MYDYIGGSISLLNPTQVVLDVGGVGYLLNISLHTHEKIQGKEKVRLFVHLQVREDLMELFGFFSEEERTLFRHLISVSGVGTNTARIILSSLSPSEVQAAILSENIVLFKSVKGIGLKTAQRIILDLKDKVSKESLESSGDQRVARASETEEAIHALLALGFPRPKVRKAIDTIMKGEKGIQSTEQLIKSALKIMT